jgi:predicted nucleotidyltransferase
VFTVERQLGVLTAYGVEFVVVGGIAATLLGSPTDTFDLDVRPAQEPANLEARGKALVELEARLRGVDESVPFVPDGDALARVQVLTLDTAAGPLDVLIRPAGSPPYRELRRRAERKDLGNFAVLVAGLDDLIAMKATAGRPKDLVMVEHLHAIKRLRKRLGISS